MKSIALVGLVLVAASVFVTKGLSPRSATTVQAANGRINVKDLSYRGLHLTNSADPAFGDLISNVLQGRSDVIVDSLATYSVFVSNKTKKTVVACVLKWEMVTPKGRTVTWRREFTNLLPLMDKEISEVKEGFLILPDGSWFFAPSIHQLDQSPNAKPIEYGANVMADLNQSLADLTQFTSITVSLDGAMFEDGSFVGPDTTDFFAKVQAMRNGRRDAYLAVAGEADRGSTNAEVFRHIQQSASVKINLNRKSSALDYYESFKKDAAAELLRQSSVEGEAKTISLVREKLKKQWPELRKLKEN